MKGEMKANPANGGGKTSAIKLGKSEDNAEVADLKAQIAGLTKAVTILCAAPLRKAITTVVGLPAVAGQPKDVSGLTKSEITARLSEKTRDPKLEKKDREAINGFYDGRYDVSKIAHLLQ